MSDLRTKIQKLAGTFGLDIVQKITCTVVSYDEGDRSCMVTPVNSNISTFKAQLMAETDDGILILPTKGSTVKVLYSTMNAPTVIQFSEIDSMYYVAGGCSILVYKSGLNLNGKSFFGIPKVAELTKQYNAIEADVNQLKGLLATAVAAIVSANTTSPTTPVLSGTLFTYFSPLAPYAAKPLVLTLQKQIENTTVKHGSGPKS